jgi:hypothetical protein
MKDDDDPVKELARKRLERLEAEDDMVKSGIRFYKWAFVVFWLVIAPIIVGLAFLCYFYPGWLLKHLPF